MTPRRTALLAILGLLPALPAWAQEAWSPDSADGIDDDEAVYEDDDDDQGQAAPQGDWQSYAPPMSQPLAPDQSGGPIDERTWRPVLDPHGSWANIPPYGWVWTPNPGEVGPGWRPYTRGHWVYTNYGWSWASDYRWGWVPFHYGRWQLLGDRWFWIPGREWAPAWVAWRTDDEVVGWAPLPYGVAVGATIQLGPVWWSFVPVGYLGARVLSPYYMPYHRVGYYYGRTRPLGYVHRHGHGWGWYRGPRRGWVEHRWGRPVNVVRYRDAPGHRYAPARRGDHFAPARGNGGRGNDHRYTPSRGNNRRGDDRGYTPSRGNRGGRPDARSAPPSQRQGSSYNSAPPSSSKRGAPARRGTSSGRGARGGDRGGHGGGGHGGGRR